jgi:DNA-binding NarL/FixJ family response regulator
VSDGRKYVLLVNHQPLFCKAFGETLVHKDHSIMVSFVTEAKTALKHLGLRPCDLVLVDTRLPVVDGLQLLLRIRERFPHLKRALMATNVSQAELQKAVEYGASSYIAKPASPSDYDAAALRVVQLLKETPNAVRDNIDLAVLNEAVGAEVTQGKDLTVAIYMGFDRGTLVFSGGRLVHAETQALKGSDAMHEILTWHDGIFEKRGGAAGSKRTLDLPWAEVFQHWKDEFRKRPSLNTAVVNREFRTFVSGEAAAQPKPDAQKEKRATSRISRVAPKVQFGEKLLEQTGVSLGLQLDAHGNIQHEFRCPDPTLMRGVISFTLAKSKEVAEKFQWEMPLSVHYVSQTMSLAVFPYKQSTVLLGWPTKQTDVLEKVNRTFGEESLDLIDGGKSPLASTVDAVKKVPGLHGYAIFRKPLQMLVKKFSAQWSFEMLELVARVSSQMCTILRLQGMPLELIQIKFKVGSILSRPVGDMTLIVISHSQTKTPLLKDGLLRISGNEIKKAAQ